MDFLQSFLGSSWIVTFVFKFLRLFRFAVFPYSSCSVIVSYFMLIPVFVILLFFSYRVLTFVLVE